MPIRCITLDWGDTLAANYGMPYQATMRLAFDQLGLALAAAGCRPGGDFRARCLTELAGPWRESIDPVKNPEHREFDFQALLTAWVAVTLTADSDHLQVEQALQACVDRMTDTVLPYTETVPVLAALQARGLRLGILSHVAWPGAACRRWFARHGLAPYLDFYSLSCEVGWIKPAPQHFAHAMALAGVRPDEILHVGDHPVRDVAGGRQAGLRTCLRLTEGIYPEEQLSQAQADHRILQLAELLTLPELLHG
jgi:FMN phosphatase YigB (HAD superfamily)